VNQPLTLIGVDLPSPPLLDKAAADGTRSAYGPSAAEAVATKLGRSVQWVVAPGTT
jgi:polar amino acid transport system substrate-binding protein